MAALGQGTTWVTSPFLRPPAYEIRSGSGSGSGSGPHGSRIAVRVVARRGDSNEKYFRTAGARACSDACGAAAACVAGTYIVDAAAGGHSPLSTVVRGQCWLSSAKQPGGGSPCDDGACVSFEPCRVRAMYESAGCVMPDGKAP